MNYHTYENQPEQKIMAYGQNAWVNINNNGKQAKAKGNFLHTLWFGAESVSCSTGALDGFFMTFLSSFSSSLTFSFSFSFGTSFFSSVRDSKVFLHSFPRRKKSGIETELKDSLALNHEMQICNKCLILTKRIQKNP